MAYLVCCSDGDEFMATQQSDLDGARVLVGVCGGISAFKTIQLVSQLVKSNADVQVILTPSAFEFVGPASFQGLTGHVVHSDIFDIPEGQHAAHIELGLWADVYVIAPVTASTLAKLANGLADNLLVATFLAVKCPVLLAPAMNSRMWAHGAVQTQVQRVKEMGVKLVGPETGPMACGEPGTGRMSEPDDIYAAIVRCLDRRNETNAGSQP